MEPRENIPLDEAVKRGLIPCAGCGGMGAEAKRVDGKPHFLCAKCTSPRAPAWVLGLLGAAVVAGAAVWLSASGPATPGQEEAPDWFVEADGLLRAGKFREARVRLEAAAKERPREPGPHAFLGKCLLGLGYNEAALAAFKKAVELDSRADPMGPLWVGIATQRLGWSAEALPLLENPAPHPAVEAQRQDALLECLLDLERYEQALKLMGDDPRRAWERHRALRYGGKAAEADALLERLAPKDSWSLRSTKLREDGDFEGALAALRGAKAERPKLVRAELALAVEMNDVPRVLALAAELAGAEGLWFRAVAQLLAGKRDDARATAEAYLKAGDPELSMMRLDRLQMRFLAGQADAAELEAEAKRVSRVRANDLYWFLALATGERAWAGKGLEATPGRNFPYHSLKRLAAK